MLCGKGAGLVSGSRRPWGELGEPLWYLLRDHRFQSAGPLSRVMSLSEEAQEIFLFVAGAVISGHRAACHWDVHCIGLDSGDRSIKVTLEVSSMHPKLELSEGVP